MCTLLYLPWRSGPFTAALGLNRDEVYDRPSAPPRWWPPEPGSDGCGFVAPVDLRAGGTWFGVAQSGLFAALTNGRQRLPFRHQRSRGELVALALRLGELDAIADSLASHDALAYAACHVFLAQGERAVYVAPEADGRFVVHELASTPHTLTNAGLDLGDTPPLPADTGRLDADGVAAQLRAVLATHEGPHARCRHGGDRGTRSSAVVLLGRSLAASELRSAAGPPCVTAYADVPLGQVVTAGVAG
jgi:hypothetical protein